MDHAARIRQRVLALFLPVAAVLYIGCEALSPRGTDQLITTRGTALRLLAIAARHPSQLYIAGSLAVLGLGAVAVSYAAIAALVRDRGSALATIAALIGGVGAFCGALVNVLGFPLVSAYAASKAAVRSMTRSLARELLDRGVRVNAISPGGVFNNQEPAFVEKLARLIPMGRMARVDEYCAAIQFLCSDASSYMTGQNIVMDGGRSVW